MKLAEEIAYDIWSSDGFKTDLSRLLKKAYLKTSPHLRLETQQTEEPFDSTALARLLQSAAIFADTSHEGFREAAQRICTAALKICDDDDSVQRFILINASAFAKFPRPFAQ